MGVAKAFFLPSGVGGNTYKVKATLAGKSGESPTLTVFRKIVLKPFEMAGQTQVSKNGTTAAMAAFYTSATFVKYELGTVGHLDAKFKVKYVALWDHASQRQLIWDTERKKTAAETPTASETTDANGPAGAAQTTARAAVQARANAWHARIEAVHLAGLQSWATDAGLPVNVIVGVEDRHPKFSANAPESDAVTAEWTAFPWLRITVQGRSLAPDTRWKNVQGFSFEKRAYIMAGLLDARAQVVVAHEAGHETKNQFKRHLFGVEDHSPAAGLMDTTATVSAFSAREIEILRGIL